MALQSKRTVGAELGERWQSMIREATTGRFLPLTPTELGKTWGKRFATDEIEKLVISRRTLARRKAKRENLSAEETDKALRLARIAAEAERVFASRERADRWLRTPHDRLAGQTPLSLLKSEAGAYVVEEMLIQIDHGIYA